MAKLWQTPPVALLDVVGVSVRFGGISALSNVDLDVAAADITGLIGPNGAGKTTLFNVIGGLQPVAFGRVLLDGDDISGLPPHRRARLGIARTFQRLETFGSMTVLDNVRVAADARRQWSDAPASITVALEVLERVGLSDVAGERAGALPTGTARLVEVARAIASAPRLLLLDEPSSGLSEEETDQFADLLVGLARDGLGVLLVEHDVELVMRICSRIHVLDFGRIIATGTPAEVQQDRAVQAAYLGAVAAE